MSPNRHASDRDSIISSSSAETSISIRANYSNTSIGPKLFRPLPQVPVDAPSLPPKRPEMRPLMALLPPPRQNIQNQISPPIGRRSHHPQCIIRRRTLIVICIVSFTLSIAAVTILSVMLFKQKQEMGEKFREGDYEACLRCIILKQNADDISSDPLFQKLHNKMENGELICCATTNQGLSALLQLMTRRLQNITIPEPLSKDVYKFSPVSAHVTFMDRSPHLRAPIFEKEVVLKLKKNSVTENSKMFHARKVQVDDNALVIQHTGWYYVYSSVYFYPVDHKHCREYKTQTWGSFITRVSPNRPDQSGCLAKTAHTCCDNCQYDHHSSFTGGVFYLLAGDNVFVSTSADGIVRYNDEVSNFLGLVMLGTNKQAELN